MSRSVALSKPSILVAARLCVIGAAVVLSGCASKQASYEPPARVAGPPPDQWKVEIEEDGLPTQIGQRNPRPLQDDPREPWSPNYGRSASQKAAPAATAPVSPVAQGNATTARRPAVRVTEMDEDAIVRRAIAEHEMRRSD